MSINYKNNFSRTGPKTYNREIINPQKTGQIHGTSLLFVVIPL